MLIKATCKDFDVFKYAWSHVKGIDCSVQEGGKGEGEEGET